jgi:hypothetical protein
VEIREVSTGNGEGWIGLRLVGLSWVNGESLYG